MNRIIFVTTVSQSLDFFRGVIEKFSGVIDVCVVANPDKRLKNFASRHGVRAAGVPMQRHISPLSDLRAVWRMWRLMRRERPVMAHSMTPKAGLVTMLAGWLARVPVRVHTFTGLVFPTATGLRRRLLMATDWLTCACATHVIPEGEGVRRDLLDNGITRKPIRVLGHGNVRGIDLEHYKPEPGNAVADNGTFTFLFVGRVVGDKGINELVEAFLRLHSDHPATRLVLVGGEELALDPVSPATRRAISECKAIEAVGEQADVRPFYAAATALVHPSYREGFPNVVIEAGAMGLPSIVTDINGSREIIINGTNGVIVPPRDTEALYQAMKHFVENPDEVRRMAEASRPLIASRYEQGYVRRCLLDFYNEILPPCKA